MVNKGFMKIRVGQEVLDFDLVLYDDVVPKTVQNFAHYLQERKAAPKGYQQSGYKNSCFHRIIRGFMAQGGDIVRGNGTGSTSIYGGSFADENFVRRHDRPGVLSMANSGKDTNGSQFFITFRPTPHLDHKHVVFGHVDLTTNASRNNLKTLENVRTDRNDRPVHNVQIMDCGIVTDEKDEPSDPEQKMDEKTTSNTQSDEGKIAASETAKDENELELEEEEEEEPPKTKAEALRQRMRKLKMKMNQARQLNKKEVLREGERLGSVEGAAKARKRQQAQDRQSKEREWKTKNAKALEVAAAAGLDGKYLVQQADASIQKANLKEKKRADGMFSAKDYHNPQGMHRNYERDLKSLPSAAAALTDDLRTTSTGTFDPILSQSDEQREREGARNLANELKRRIEKQKNKRNRLDFEQEDVTWINKRNKMFNKKISRDFDKHTAEIRQNLERGTAL